MELDDLYSLKEHLENYFNIDNKELNILLQNGTKELATTWKNWEVETSHDIKDYYKSYIDNNPCWWAGCR